MQSITKWIWNSLKINTTILNGVRGCCSFFYFDLFFLLRLNSFIQKRIPSSNESASQLQLYSYLFFIPHFRIWWRKGNTTLFISWAWSHFKHTEENQWSNETSAHFEKMFKFNGLGLRTHDFVHFCYHTFTKWGKYWSNFLGL